MNLYHYYDLDHGAFRTISDLPDEQALALEAKIRADKPDSQCASRFSEYLHWRRHYEDILRDEFRKMGGRMERENPHYMVVEACPWLWSWYEKPALVKIPLEAFDPRTISFTYGDSHPTFSPRCKDNKEYRKRLYDVDGIRDLIARYGYPQEWNADGAFGPERYIEVQVWSDETIGKYVDLGK